MQFFQMGTDKSNFLWTSKFQWLHFAYLITKKDLSFSHNFITQQLTLYQAFIENIQLQGASSYRPHNLIIPSNSLEPGRKYKFRISAVYANSEEAYAEFTVQTKMKPSSGFVEVKSHGSKILLNYISIIV